MDLYDYVEPQCPLDNSMWVKNPVQSIPINRVIQKVDELYSKNDYESAEKVLLNWLKEAENGNDRRGQLAIYNELMGLYRKISKSAEAKKYAQLAISVVTSTNINKTVAGATTYLNSGTVYKAFGEPEVSIKYFKLAENIYVRELKKDDDRLAGLYNNMALTLVDLSEYDEARKKYRSAIDIMNSIGNKSDEAISWLNLADCAAKELGLDKAENEINCYIEKANFLLDSVPECDRDGYYAYVCEKCSPVFEYYGWFIYAKKFKEAASKIYIAQSE